MKRFTIKNRRSELKKKVKNLSTKLIRENILFLIILSISTPLIFLSQIQLNFKLIILVAFFITYLIIKTYLELIKENRILKKVTSKYLDPKIEKTLVQNPQYLINKSYQKDISILFCDLRNYSLISEKLSPNELLSLTNNFFNSMSEIIADNDGTIDKFIGDEIMVFWNAPNTIKNYKTKTIKTALEMKKKLNNLNQELNLELKFGIGINSGNASIGSIGGIYKSNYTIIGPHVNLAARLQTLTKKYEVPILISEYSKENSEKVFNLRKIDTIKVKGFNKAINIYEPFLKSNKKRVLLKSKYELAFEFYQNREWQQAEKILRGISYDGPAKLLLERIENKSPQSGWSGVYDWNKILSI